MITNSFSGTASTTISTDAPSCPIPSAGFGAITKRIKSIPHLLSAETSPLPTGDAISDLRLPPQRQPCFHHEQKEEQREPGLSPHDDPLLTRRHIKHERPTHD